LAGYIRGGPNGGAYRPANLQLLSYSYNNPVALRDPTGRAVTDQQLELQAQQRAAISAVAEFDARLQSIDRHLAAINESLRLGEAQSRLGDDNGLWANGPNKVIDAQSHNDNSVGYRLLGEIGLGIGMAAAGPVFELGEAGLGAGEGAGGRVIGLG